MKARDAQKWRNRLLVIGILIMLAANLYEALLGVGTIVALSCLIPDFLYNKCPRCGKHLGRNEAAYCQYCGGKIDG